MGALHSRKACDVARTSDFEMYKRRKAVLRCIRKAAEEGSGQTDEACLSIAQIARRMKLSDLQARRILDISISEGLLAKKPCFHEDGGQTGNIYRITARGRRMLDSNLRTGDEPEDGYGEAEASVAASAALAVE